MKMLAEYVENAIKFEKMAAEEKDATLKERLVGNVTASPLALRRCSLNRACQPGGVSAGG
jgi:hypothetical protein